MWWWSQNFKFFEVVNEDLMNQVASVPKKLQPYVMAENTEVKENLAKLKRASLAGNSLRSSWGHFINRYHTASNQKQ